LSGILGYEYEMDRTKIQSGGLDHRVYSQKSVQMSIFQSKVLYFPRQIFKQFLQFLYPLFFKIWKLPVVLSIDDTLDKIIKDKSSICRYGDGEFLVIIHNVDLPFQKFDPILRNRMIEILKSDFENILVGLPIGYYSMENLTRKSKLTWTSHIVWTYPHLKKYFNLSKTYYNSSMTRPYVNYADKSVCRNYFEKLKSIWEGREILLIEGEKSRLGVGNDLFNQASKIERILAPSINAFSIYNKLLEEVLKHFKSKLILIALGPTATILAYDLAKSGYQALDIGNVDIEYEWYLLGTNKKVRIPCKYSNEVAGGGDVEDVKDDQYERQIIKRLLIDN
jgi:glycosyltransferase family protein